MSKVILAFESSCDETACAICRDGREILADVNWGYNWYDAK